MNLVLSVFGRQSLVTQWFVRDLADATTSVWVAYTVSVPLVNSSGAQLDEPDPLSGYGRLELPLDTTAWAPTGFGEIYNVNEEMFSIPTAPWGIIVGLALADDAAVGAGNVLAAGPLAEPFTAIVGRQPILEIGALTIGLYE